MKTIILVDKIDTEHKLINKMMKLYLKAFREELIEFRTNKDPEHVMGIMGDNVRVLVTGAPSEDVEGVLSSGHYEVERKVAI